MKEHRVIAKGNLGGRVNWFTILGDKAFANYVAEIIETAEQAHHDPTFTGAMMAFAVKAADDPEIRRKQYFMLLQAIEERFGPRTPTEFLGYFPKVS